MTLKIPAVCLMAITVLFGADTAFQDLRFQKINVSNTLSETTTFELLSRYIFLQTAQDNPNGFGIVPAHGIIEAAPGAVFYGAGKDDIERAYPKTQVRNYSKSPYEIAQKHTLTLNPGETTTLELPFPHYFSGIRGITNFEWDTVDDAVTVKISNRSNNIIIPACYDDYLVDDKQYNFVPRSLSFDSYSVLVEKFLKLQKPKERFFFFSTKEKYEEKHDLNNIRVWISDEEPDLNLLNSAIENVIALNMNLVLYCKDKRRIPLTLQRLRESGIGLKVVDLFEIEDDSLYPKKIIDGLIDNQYYTIASNLIRYYALYKEGGIYCDLGATVLPQSKEYLNRYDHIFVTLEREYHLIEGFMFAKKNSIILRQFLNFYLYYNAWDAEYFNYFDRLIGGVSVCSSAVFPQFMYSSCRLTTYAVLPSDIVVKFRRTNSWIKGSGKNRSIVLYPLTSNIVMNYFNNPNAISYFDDYFYFQRYSDLLGGKSPKEHFLTYDFFTNREDCVDPNSWFNSALYIITFDCKKNPYLDYFSQKTELQLSKKNKVHVYANFDELTRSWLAIEYILRTGNFCPVLHLSSCIEQKELTRFRWQQKRGLILCKDNNDNISFYKSDFFKQPIDNNSYPKYFWSEPVSSKISNLVLVHRLYKYTNWQEKARINPLRINVCHYVDEPLFSYSTIGSYLKKIQEGFDLIFFSDKINAKTMIIPGYMDTWINIDELSEKKEFSVSFLLSMGGAGINHSVNQSIYQLRRLIWENKERININKRFYISLRDKESFPSEFKNYALPTDSKKWIFDSQFTIVLENCKQENYMTEKLLGPFVALSVPIYLGCPNVRDWFDERGMFIAESVEEVIQICQSITPETYANMLPYLEENRRRAHDLLGLENRLIQKFIDENVS